MTGKPLVYASLGTIVNGLEHVYRIILEAVGKFPEIQTVLSVGKNINPDVLGAIPPNVLVVSAAPQIALLKRASLCITHAGLNTTLESLAQGVPLVAIPIGYDQPGVAARIAHHGVGEFVAVGDLTADRLLELISASPQTLTTVCAPVSSGMRSQTPVVWTPLQRSSSRRSKQVRFQIKPQNLSSYCLPE